MTLNLPMKPLINKNLPIKEGSSQVILCNSNRNAKDFLKSLKLRTNGKYEKIPNYFWDEYSLVQINETAKLIKKVCNKNDIPNNFIGHNVLVEGIENFRGVTSRSNYSEYWTDINPSFNFNVL